MTKAIKTTSSSGILQISLDTNSSATRNCAVCCFNLMLLEIWYKNRRYHAIFKLIIQESKYYTRILYIYIYTLCKHQAYHTRPIYIYIYIARASVWLTARPIKSLWISKKWIKFRSTSRMEHHTLKARFVRVIYICLRCSYVFVGVAHVFLACGNCCLLLLRFS